MRPQSYSSAVRVYPPAMPCGLRTVLWGHSYIDQEAFGATDEVQNGYRLEGTIAWANMLMGKPMQIVAEIGRGGWLVDDMRAVWDTDVAPLKPQLVIVNLAHNDLKGYYAGNAGQQPNDSGKRRLDVLMRKFREWLTQQVPPSCRVVLLAETPPGRNPAGTYAFANRQQLGARFLQWNAFQRGLALEFPNVMYVPLDRVTLDPAEATITNKLGHYYDQTHPSIVGAYHRGKMLAKYLERVLPIHSDLLPTLHADAFTRSKMTTTTKPAFSGGVGTLLFGTGANEFNSGSTVFRHLDIGDYVTVRFLGATDRIYCGRYRVLSSSADGITIDAAGKPDTAATANHADVSNCAQYFCNPLFLTTTGGGTNAGGNVGTITGTLPLGATINNLPTGWTVNVSTATAHTQRDGSAGFGNWLTLTVDAPSTPGYFALRFIAGHNSGGYGAGYDVEGAMPGVVDGGTTFQAGCEVRIESSQANLGSVECWLQLVTQNQGGGGQTYRRGIEGLRDVAMDPKTSSYPFPAGEDMHLTMTTPEVRIVESPGSREQTSGYIEMQIHNNGSLTGQVIRIGRAGAWAVDRPIERIGISYT